ncbi:MAG: DUF1015 domain-containing protein [Sarcina sp.]
MIKIKPFKALRPKALFAKEVAALPYDVMSSAEAREMVKGNDKSFLRVDRAEVNLDKNANQYSEEVYETAKNILDNMIKDEIFIEEDKNCFYIYEQIFKGNRQRGLVLTASIDDYIENRIKKHEHTTVKKELDRINHVDYCNANTGPIFLTYKNKKNISELINEICIVKKTIYDFLEDDGVNHRVWKIEEDNIIGNLIEEFKLIENLYIADGHHRAASAIKVGEKRRKQFKDYTGEEEFNYFLAVAFPDNELKIMDYNRVVKDLNGLTKEEFIEKVKRDFIVDKINKLENVKIERCHKFAMYLDKVWYSLEAKKGTFNNLDPVKSLDVSILQDNLLNPILNIKDPRNDNRIEFIGGIRGLKELERRVNLDMEVAFAMYPTTIEELISVADSGRVMPPKSTWFEPKLRSGLFIHRL